MEGLGYKFDREETQKQRSRRLKGRNIDNDTLPRAKRTKPASRRKNKAQPRKNRPHKDYIQMSLECCTEKTCLLNQGRYIIDMIRREFDGKLYEEQNTYLNSMIEVCPRNARNRISYNIRDVSGLRKVKVCKEAFKKIFGVGNKRIAVLLKKIKPYSGDVEQDQRRFNRNQKKIPLSLKAEVIQHISSYKRQESHYAREKTKDMQFLDSKLTIAQLWRDFLASKELSLGNDLPLSYSTFRRIFRKFKLSFKKPYVDTCGRCDSLSVVIKYSQDEEEIASAKDLKESHIQQADERYDCIHFDLEILPKTKNKAHTLLWETPPLWK